MSSVFKANIDGSSEDPSVVGSPMKRQRASVADSDTDSIQRRLGSGMAGTIGEILATSSPDPNEQPKQADPPGDGEKDHFGGVIVKKKAEDDEEL
jgi:hypothetical protein